MTKQGKTTDNSTIAIGGVLTKQVRDSADGIVLTESLHFRLNICGKKPTHRKSAKSYRSL